MENRRRAAFSAVFGLYLVWAFATWWFEGRILTLLRPTAVADRITYSLVVNMGIGVVGGMALAGWLVRSGALTPSRSGFSRLGRTLAAAAAGFLLGLAAYLAQGAPTIDPIVLLNANAQAMVVSAAEIFVCWVLVAGAILGAGPEGPRRRLAAVVMASVLFGAYHLGHSPPFNSPTSIAMLTAVGVLTSVVFLVSRDLVGTLLFHNWLAVFGVVGALAEADALDVWRTPQPPLLIMAAAALLLALIGRWWVGRAAIPP